MIKNYTHGTINAFSKILAANQSIQDELAIAPDADSFAQCYKKIALQFGFDISITEMRALMKKRRLKRFEHIGEKSV